TASIPWQITLVRPLTDPTAFGGRSEDAFDVVIPSIPGYGFSGKPTATGWDPVHIARAWIVLMRRLGYTRYVAQGGDVGGLITDAMAVEAPAELVASVISPRSEEHTSELQSHLNIVF